VASDLVLQPSSEETRRVEAFFDGAPRGEKLEQLLFQLTYDRQNIMRLAEKHPLCARSYGWLKRNNSTQVNW